MGYFGGDAASTVFIVRVSEASKAIGITAGVVVVVCWHDCCMGGKGGIGKVTIGLKITCRK